MKTNKLKSPVKAIKQHCIDCSGGILSEVRNCVITDCPLYSFRKGVNPSRKGIGGKRVGYSIVSLKN